jgi:hypothetical protein
MSVYCITSVHSVGCTFFDWSIHFLSGQTRHYNLKQNQWVSISSDPVQDLNAHGHEKNHPMGFEHTKKYAQTLLSLPQDQLYSLYPFQLKLFPAANQLNLSIESISTPSVKEQLFQYITADFDQLFEFCNQQNIKLIYVNSNHNTQLYHIKTRAHDRGMLDDMPFSSLDKEKQQIQKIFFKDSVATWSDLGLTDIWDQRERLALDSRPFLNEFQKPTSLNYPHLWIDSQELWYNGEGAVLKMLQYLELDVAPQRLDAWKLVYAKWQAKQLEILNFCYNYQHIVDSIVNNWYYNIDLTFDQEVVIQHCLIYQHNLNLKTWQLSKFPNNTQDLHKLLEPNTHPVVPY